MKKNNFDASYWETRYENDYIGWDLGEISTPLKTYIDQLTNKNVKILLPGAGNSYEAEYLWHRGFKNIFVLDIAKLPLKNLRKRIPDFPVEQCLKMDFFDLEMHFDLILEQTFFCAVDPTLREKYVNKMYDLQKPKGKLIGLFFDFKLTENGPPFGGDKSSYTKLFKACFKIKTIERAYNSIEARRNKELFFIFEKK